MQTLPAGSGPRRGAVLVATSLGVAVALGAGGVAALARPTAAPRTGTAAPSPSPTATPSPPAPYEPLVRQVVQATSVSRVSGDAFFRRATLDRRPEELAVLKDVGPRLDPQDAAALLVVLPLAAARPECVRSATLQLDVASTTGGPVQLAVYPGAATSLVEGHLPASGPEDVAAILDTRPRGAADVPLPGPLEVDVTELARTWAAGGPFPSTGRRIEPGTPLLLVLRPPDAAPGTWTLALAAPPTLTYRWPPGCRQR